ncbi:unnamed protein product [[Candida] boidinii]|uniref:Unnamed protein product n=1 Tax=Candida boidinii TaxID=5477 RepID=A0A9W6WFU3_CANBO|nr:NADH dehydrogenase (ubiquinone) activity protein [[Candida] boidinii]OWB69543.1 NADH dehydrogenase (ubiquinone) activity protein [[Candida] boidinii]OWB85594.1 NADH dehydrogenase (ubiquinone) activity protein [[Candida] boidinii]GME67600.1 unnamed protein product [[Candida] boidinii]GME94332.1 unnamed protein product [[Candida] boidinii]
MSARFALPKAVKEIRFFLSQTGEASVPLRTFLTKTYPALKKANPSLPILVREAYGIPPTLTTRLEKGLEVKTNLEGLSESEILKALTSASN